MIKPGDLVSYGSNKYFYVGDDYNGVPILCDISDNSAPFCAVRHLMAPWVAPKPTKVFLGYVVLFENGETEYWKYNPNLLNRGQMDLLGVVGFTPFEVKIAHGDGFTS